MVNRRWAVGGLTAVACLFAVTGVVQATHSWGGYHWARTANPFTLKVGQSLPGRIRLVANGHWHY